MLANRDYPSKSYYAGYISEVLKLFNTVYPFSEDRLMTYITRRAIELNRGTVLRGRTSGAPTFIPVYALNSEIILARRRVSRGNLSRQRRR